MIATSLILPNVPAAAQPWALVDAYLRRLRQGGLDAGGGRFLWPIEDALLRGHNVFRAELGLRVLLRAAELDQAARAHAADLVARDYFDHASPEGFRVVHRVGLLSRRLVGAWGENLVSVAGGGSPPTAKVLIGLWEQSAAHRLNMVRANYTHVGFGVAQRGDHVLAAAVFGEVYAELASPAPLNIGIGRGLSRLTADRQAHLTSYELQPFDGSRDLGPFAFGEAPDRLPEGAYFLRPHGPDPAVPNRYFILYGPVVLTV